MSRVFFRSELETVGTYWRIFRRDGVALGFTSHDRDLLFGGLRHRAAPGMVPSAIRRTAALAADNLEVQGVLAHDAISAEDLDAGRFDQARIEVGLVDWETREHAALFAGAIGQVSTEAGRFEAELLSAKADLERDPVPYTSPTCRARFCDADCGLGAAGFTHLAALVGSDAESGLLTFAPTPDAAHLRGGTLRWLDGRLAGITMDILDASAGGVRVARTLDPAPLAGQRAFLREGCDHTLATCATRFGNAVNFRGEPFLPGNDLLARYPGGGGA